MQVYTEFDIFEEVLLFPDKYPNWSAILKHHAEVCVNLSQSDHNAKLHQGEVLFEYMHASGGKAVEPLESHFAAIAEDPEVMLHHPRAAYILNRTRDEADALSTRLGLVVQSSGALDEAVLVKPYLFKDLPKGEVFEAKGKKGWPVVMNIGLPPSNAMLVLDPYLLGNDNGLLNLTQLCDALLPASVDVPYHITVVTKHNDRKEDWRNKMAGDINTAIKNLRTYTIDVEVVFQHSEQYHRRRVLLNYANMTCDKGFACFKQQDGRTVATANDVRFELAFHEPGGAGNSHFASATKDLETVKQETTKLAGHILQATGVDLGSIKGACNANKTLKNRLINDV